MDLQINHPNVHHENRSRMILNYMIKKYNIEINDAMLDDIMDLIHPSGKNESNKKFLYHIIANPENGIDVDKFDYIKRDTYNLGLPYSIDLERLLETARVIDNQICYPEKMLFSICGIYETRGRLHKEIYNHPVVLAIEMMVGDMLSMIKMDWAKSISTPEEFLKLHDGIIFQLHDSSPANIVQQQIWERDLYKYIDQVIVPITLSDSITNLIEEFKHNNQINSDSLVVMLYVHIGYCKNPLQKLDFIILKKIRINHII